MAAVLLIVFIVLLIAGLPIGFSMAATAALLFWIYGLASIQTLTNYMYSAVNSFTLLSIPFFILVGSFLGGGKVVRYVYELTDSFLGNIRGGIGMAVILTSAVLAAISGSSMANAAALSMILLPTMVEFGHQRGEAAAMIATGGTLGILIPPSLTMILFGVITNQSVGHLFMSGVVPGIVMVIILMITVRLVAPKTEKRHKTTIGRWQAFKKAGPILMAPVIILGGIYLGWFTPEEAAAVAIVYCILITVFWYKTLSVKDVGRIILEGSNSSATIMFLVSGAMVFSYVATVSQIPQGIMEGIGNSGLSLPVILILVNIILLIMGCFLDVYSIMLLTVPVLYPILTKLGVDPFQLAVIYTLNMEIGTITPPVGMNLYAITGTTGVPIDETVKFSWPYFIALVIGLIVVSVFPTLSNWLPSMLK